MHQLIDLISSLICILHVSVTGILYIPGGVICLSPPINNEGGGRLFFFAGVSGVRWKSPVTPGKQRIRMRIRRDVISMVDDDDCHLCACR